MDDARREVDALRTRLAELEQLLEPPHGPINDRIRRAAGRLPPEELPV